MITTLLVPSISSKPRPSLKPLNLIPKIIKVKDTSRIDVEFSVPQHIKDGNFTPTSSILNTLYKSYIPRDIYRFNIVVGNVCVYSGKSSYKTDIFNLIFPSTAPLAVARDDILLYPNVVESMIIQLCMVVRHFIENVKKVKCFIDCLDNYANYSSQCKAKYIVTMVNQYI